MRELSRVRDYHRRLKEASKDSVDGAANQSEEHADAEAKGKKRLRVDKAAAARHVKGNL